jgi:addiction module RelE/StbE family toxin
MDYNVEMSPQAIQDLDDAIAYIKKDSLQSAQKMHHALLASARSLRSIPMRGVKREELLKNCRILISNPYVLVYTIKDTRVSIVRILHQSQNAHNMFE